MHVDRTKSVCGRFGFGAFSRYCPRASARPFSPQQGRTEERERKSLHRLEFRGLLRLESPRAGSAVKIRPSRSGFTLVEMMVVMALIGIVSAMIIPEMKGTYEDALLRSTSRKLVNVFHLAYSRAVTLNQTQRVRLDEGSGRFMMEARVGIARGVDDFVPVHDLAGGSVELDKRIALTIHRPESSSESTQDRGYSSTAGGGTEQARANAIAFYPDGTADGVEFELRDRQGFRLALRINSVTARVHVVEMPRQ